ncbi:hypothetical protein H5410_021490, partial [Solanum commersonii]
MSSATQDSIMNAQKKTQLTHARINCALKDSSCDPPLSKALKLTILSSNASSSSTKIRNQNATLTLTKMNTMHDFTHKLPLFSNQQLFQLTQDQKGLFKACNGLSAK